MFFLIHTLCSMLNCYCLRAYFTENQCLTPVTHKDFCVSISTFTCLPRKCFRLWVIPSHMLATCPAYLSLDQLTLIVLNVQYKLWNVTQPLTEMSTRNIYWGYSRPVLRADNLTTFMCRLSWNMGASNLLERSEPVQASNGIPLPLQIIKFLKVHFSLHSPPLSSAAWPISSIRADLNYWWTKVSACVFVPEFK